MKIAVLRPKTSTVKEGASFSLLFRLKSKSPTKLGFTSGTPNQWWERNCRERKNCNGSGVESTWDERKVQAQRLQLLLDDPSTAPTERGVLVIDETGDRKDGHKTAHVSRQYLANLGKIDNGVVSVSSLWADERVYYPVDFEPYTPAVYFAKGKNDPQFRTKLKIALQLVERALQEGIPFQAVVADSLDGEDRGFLPTG
jgi:SRSO17 transposase